MVQRTVLIPVLVLGCSTIAGTARAAVEVRMSLGAEDAPSGVAPETRVATPKASRPADVLLVPRYFVDPAAGDTTLFAVRNVTVAPAVVEIEYFGLAEAEGPQQTEVRLLDAKSTYTVNLRDVPGLTPQPDGSLKGFIRITHDAETEGALSGDYFQVDQLESFATGDRLLGPGDLCNGYEIRFLEGGGFDGGTILVFFFNDPQGADSQADPPSALLTLYDEAGDVVASGFIHSSQNTAALAVANFGLPVDFGTLEVDFTSSSGGAVLADYSASGKYSIGLNGTCTD